MKVVDLFEAGDKGTEKKLLAVIYGGRFQPFHKGHFAAFKQLGKWFGSDNVWIATSDKTTGKDETEDVSFLDFQERKELMVTMFKINPDHIVKCKNPAFAPIEILKLYKAPVVCVMACGAKDAERYSGAKMFEPYPMVKGRPARFDSVSDELASSSEGNKMYYVTVPAAEHGISGTKVRERLSKVDPDARDEVHDAMRWAFGAYDPEIARMLISNLKGHE